MASDSNAATPTRHGDAPKPTFEDLRSGAHDRRLVAVSIDTSVFDAQGLRLGGPLLRRLSVFTALRSGIGVRLLLSEVVVSELRAHLVRRVAETGDRLAKALRDRAEALGASHSALELPAGLDRVDDPEVEGRAVGWRQRPHEQLHSGESGAPSLLPFGPVANWREIERGEDGAADHPLQKSTARVEHG